jgi:regulator of sigma E protease
MVRYEHPVYLDQPALIGWVVGNSPAAKAGIEQGDRIVRIDGVQNPTWEDVLLKTMIGSKQPIDIALQRGNQILDKKIEPLSEGSDPFASVGIPDEPLTVTALEPDMPAAKAGIRVGDEIVTVNGTPVRSIYFFIDFLQKNGAKPAQISIVRNQRPINLEVTPALVNENGEKSYRLGFRSEPVHIDKLPFAAAFQRSLEENKKYSLLIVDLVQKMVERKVSIKQMEGPIGIARASGEAARQPGWSPLLKLMAMISLNLGIFNLLPIPILDGGIILLLIIESLIRRDISVRIKERIYQTAFVFLLLFAVMVIYNDLMKLRG